ncbi:hypothetical protein KP509_1Z241000 [Ceratopteris richardii]|nr:hypothetical protein KP509_1Z241000 [Ceratopteris richardii]
MESHYYSEVQEGAISNLSEQRILTNTWFIYFREAVAEIIGTFLIVFTGSAGGILTNYGEMSTSICGGLSVTLMIFATGHISKAHLNPAVTLGFAMAGVFPWKQVRCECSHKRT